MATLAATLCLGLLFAGAGAASAAAAPAAGSVEAQAKLAAVRERIAALTGRIGIELKQRDTLNAQLRDADLKVTEKRRKLDALRAEELAAERRRAELRAEEAHTELALASERGALGLAVRSAYMIGRQEKMKLLLNQSDPAAFGRTLALYGYFARARSAKIDEIAEQAAHLQELVAQIEASSANLKSLEEEAGREMTELQQARTLRVAALGALGKQVADSNEQLQRLKREEQAVESLIADLARVLEDYPVDAKQSFDQLRGKLPWPVAGTVTAHFMEVRGGAAGAAMRWNGEMIETTRGAKVRACYFGRVVYADWLQGLGLLLIIGHSGNYMTLYGHAEVLYKSVGDWVAPGDVIAAVSDAAGAAPQLYFEIRDGRKPVDPKIWLKPSP